MPTNEKSYMKEYMRKYRQKAHPSDTQIYDGPPELDAETVEDMKEGLSKAEIDQLNEDIADAMAEPRLDELEEYTKLGGSALKRIQHGEAGLLFGVECNATEVDPLTGEPLKKKSEDEELSHWGRWAG